MARRCLRRFVGPPPPAHIHSERGILATPKISTSEPIRISAAAAAGNSDNRGPTLPLFPNNTTVTLYGRAIVLHAARSRLTTDQSTTGAIPTEVRIRNIVRDDIVFLAQRFKGLPWRMPGVDSEAGVCPPLAAVSCSALSSSRLFFDPKHEGAERRYSSECMESENNHVPSLRFSISFFSDEANETA